VALQSCCAVIDIKEPSRGSLGAADEATMFAICRRVAGRRPVSAALGELIECPAMGNLPCGVTFAKIGLSGMRRKVDWPSRLKQWATELPSQVQPVAVAYADCEEAESPPIFEVAIAAHRFGWKWLLIDTFAKNGRRLIDYMNRTALEELRQACSVFQLRLVLAGSLQLGDLSRLRPSRPSLWAVRGALTRGGRASILDPERVAVWDQAVARFNERASSVRCKI